MNYFRSIWKLNNFLYWLCTQSRWFGTSLKYFIYFNKSHYVISYKNRIILPIKRSIYLSINMFIFNNFKRWHEVTRSRTIFVIVKHNQESKVKFMCRNPPFYLSILVRLLAYLHFTHFHRLYMLVIESFTSFLLIIALSNCDGYFNEVCNIKKNILS